MNIDQLTPNGIERFLKGEPAILQLINTEINRRQRDGGTLQMVTTTISDGYAYFKSIYLFLDGFPNRNTQFNIVRVKLTDKVVKKIANGSQIGKAPLLTNAQQFAIISNKINKKIGNPISFQQFIRNGKKNPKGDRKFHFNQNLKQQKQEDTEDDLFQQAQKMQQKLKQNKKIQTAKEKKQTTKEKKQNQTSNSRSNLIKPSNNAQKSLPNKPIQKIQQKSPPKKNSNQYSNSHSNQLQQPQYHKNRQSLTSTKPQVHHHEGDYDKISQLFLGMENFKILGRLLFIWPVKVFTNKKGNQSQLVNMQFGDRSGTVMCTAFGDNTNRYCNTAIDMVYSITGATVTQGTFRGITQLKLTFGDTTKLNLQQKNLELIATVPTIQHFCIPLKQLIQLPKGKSATVICFVKQGELVQFTSKNGNQIKKKTLKMFDLENQIQCDLTVFNESAITPYKMGMYALKGVEVDEYNGNKQFKSNMAFMARLLKNHPMSSKLSQFQELTFTSIGSNQKQNKRQSISSFAVLNQKCQQIKVGQNVWSQVICYLKAIRLGGNSKNVYLSCPNCKKKIIQQAATQCHHCLKSFERPVYRYILNINLIDSHDNIWVSAYDDAGQQILNLPSEKQFTADSFAQSTQEQLRKRIQEIRYKQFKVKMISTKQQFNNDVRVKHKIVKILPIDFEQQCKDLLGKIKIAADLA